MTLISLTHGINREGQERVVALARSTHQGMAHFAATGPAGRTCRECRFWQHSKTWHAAGGKHGGAPMPARCRRYHELTRERGKPVPHHAMACKHFDEADRPQPLQRPRKEFEA